MAKVVFDADDIHRMRLEVAEQYSRMSPEDARRDRRERAENTRQAIEEIRRRKNRMAV